MLWFFPVSFFVCLTFLSAKLECCCVRVCGSVFGVLFCSRPGLLVPLSSFYFVCVFIMGLKDPNLCLVCPPANIAPTGISCFAVLFARYARTAWPNSLPSTTTCAPPFPCPTMPLGPTIHIPTHNCSPWASIALPDPLCLAWYVVACFDICCMSVHCACARVWCVCLRVLGCFPLVQVLTLTLNAYAYVVVPFLAFYSLVG